MDAIQKVMAQVQASTPVDLSKVVGPAGINLRAVVPVALTLAAQTEAFGHQLLGPQKMRVVQNILNEAIDGMHAGNSIDADQAKQLRQFVKDQLPWVLEGAIKALKNPQALKFVTNLCGCRY